MKNIGLTLAAILGLVFISSAQLEDNSQIKSADKENNSVLAAHVDILNAKKCKKNTRGKARQTQVLRKIILKREILKQ